MADALLRDADLECLAFEREVQVRKVLADERLHVALQRRHVRAAACGGTQLQKPVGAADTFVIHVRSGLDDPSCKGERGIGSDARCFCSGFDLCRCASTPRRP